MGLFSRRKPDPSVAWQPPQRPGCTCPRHLDDDLLRTVVPYSTSLAEDLGYAPTPVTVTDLLGPGGLSVQPALDDEQVPGQPADLTWSLGVYDDARAHYDDLDDGAEVDLDVALAGQPGVERVEWADREVFLLAAPTLCADGVLATAALTLLDDRVRSR
ncbi:hypothetical protein [uncultured Nocardioides sp.]|uniref:hypothetical protein n=1 Tax=uncultured Nocardioides sp. TaxID=198441 RepID=UPI00262BD661|nr:hypothetical protein [uncultured Nocardioides sp.]